MKIKIDFPKRERENSSKKIIIIKSNFAPTSTVIREGNRRSMRLIKSHYDIDIVTRPDQFSQLYDSIDLNEFKFKTSSGSTLNRSGTVDLDQVMMVEVKILIPK